MSAGSSCRAEGRVHGSHPRTGVTGPRGALARQRSASRAPDDDECKARAKKATPDPTERMQAGTSAGSGRSDYDAPGTRIEVLNPSTRGRQKMTALQTTRVAVPADPEGIHHSVDRNHSGGSAI